MFFFLFSLLWLLQVSGVRDLQQRLRPQLRRVRALARRGGAVQADPSLKAPGYKI